MSDSYFHNSDVFQNSKVEAVKKLSFWAHLFYRILAGKAQKLLPSAELKPQKTYKSIFYMWNLGNFRTVLFNSLDSIRNSFVHAFEKSNINSLKTQIIGKDINSSVSLKNSELAIIVPKPIIINRD